MDGVAYDIVCTIVPLYIYGFTLFTEQKGNGNLWYSWFLVLCSASNIAKFHKSRREWTGQMKFDRQPACFLVLYISQILQHVISVIDGYGLKRPGVSNLLNKYVSELENSEWCFSLSQLLPHQARSFGRRVKWSCVLCPMPTTYAIVLSSPGRCINEIQEPFEISFYCTSSHMSFICYIWGNTASASGWPSQLCFRKGL